MNKKFEIWRGLETLSDEEEMLGAVTVIDGVVKVDSRAAALSLSLADWDRTANGLGVIVETSFGHPVTILMPWEDK